MPYNPGGLFSLVASYFATPGATIRTEQHNPVFEDVASALSSVLLRDGRAPMTGPLNMNGQPINNAVAGNSPSSVATLAQAMPIGAVIDYALKTPPAGWALCTGLVLLASTPYQTLRTALINDAFPYGQDGSGNPKIPDARGCVTAGFDQMGGTPGQRLDGNFGSTRGTQTATLGAGNLPPHAHSGRTGDDSPDHAHGLGGSQSPSQQFAPTIQTIQLGANSLNSLGASTRHQHDFTTGNGPGTSTPFAIVQPTIIMNKIIRVSYDV